MTPKLLEYLVDPISKEPLSLVNETRDSSGSVITGSLVTPSGRNYPIINGIPRFVPYQLKGTVDSFGDQWNFFNFTEFKSNWLSHTVANTFGSTKAFADKLVVDAGGGSGAQTLWMLESGAQHVIIMDLSHSVDDVVLRNLKPSGFTNYDVIQCSIDAPPLRPCSIEGIVICHNVIQHTPSVEVTAKALYSIVAQGGEFVFNCYPLNDQGVIRWVRFHLIYKPLRAVLSRLPFWAILSYARAMALIRLIPIVGAIAEKFGICIQGDVPIVLGESKYQRLKRRFRNTMLNTFDGFGSHKYQHHKSEAEIRSLISMLQPNQEKILNTEKYFRRPPPIGCALRLQK